MRTRLKGWVLSVSFLVLVFFLSGCQKQLISDQSSQSHLPDLAGFWADEVYASHYGFIINEAGEKVYQDIPDFVNGVLIFKEDDSGGATFFYVFKGETKLLSHHHVKESTIILMTCGWDEKGKWRQYDMKQVLDYSYDSEHDTLTLEGTICMLDGKTERVSLRLKRVDDFEPWKGF